MRAATLLRELARAGVTLSANGERLKFDAPTGVITPALLATLKAGKTELLAVLSGNYLNAAAALVLTVLDPEERAELVYRFDERAGICEYDAGMSRGEADRQAYIELSRAMEQAQLHCLGERRNTDEPSPATI